MVARVGGVLFGAPPAEEMAESVRAGTVHVKFISIQPTIAAYGEMLTAAGVELLEVGHLDMPTPAGHKLLLVNMVARKR